MTKPEEAGWMHVVGYIVIAVAVISTIVMSSVMFNNHQSGTDTTTRNNIMYISAVLAGGVIGFGVVSVLHIVHDKLSRVAVSDNKRYIMFRYSYLLSLIIVAVLILAVSICIYQTHNVNNHVLKNSGNTIAINSYLFNNRLIPYTLLGVGIAHVIGLGTLMFLPHQYDSHRKTGIIASMAAVTLLIGSALNFYHASQRQPTADVNQQTQAFLFLALAFVLAGVALYIVFRKRKEARDKEEKKTIGESPLPPMPAIFDAPKVSVVTPA